MRKIIVGLTVAISVMIASSAEARTYTVTSTAYTPCSSGSIMADGSKTRPRSVANNFLPLGTKIKLTSPGPHGLRIFYVRDRIGHGTELDFWVKDCNYAFTWGRRVVTFKVLRYGR